MQKFQGDPKIVYCRALQEIGAHVTCVEDGLPTWVAEVIIHIVSFAAACAGTQLCLMPTCQQEGLPAGQHIKRVALRHQPAKVIYYPVYPVPPGESCTTSTMCWCSSLQNDSQCLPHT